MIPAVLLGSAMVLGAVVGAGVSLRVSYALMQRRVQNHAR